MKMRIRSLSLLLVAVMTFCLFQSTALTTSIDPNAGGSGNVESSDITRPDSDGNVLSLQGVYVKDEGGDDQVEDLGLTTGIYTEREDLLDLVIDTLNGMKERFDGYAEECEAFKTVLDELNGKSFANANQLNEKTGLDITECDGLKNLTWLDVCGSIGAAIFNELEDPYMHPANYKSGQEYLYHAIAYGVYGFDLKKDEMEIEEKDTYSIEVSSEQFDVNFEVHFEHEGSEYVCLVGNMNGKYVLLDVMRKESEHGECTTPQPDKELVPEESTIISTPSPTVEPTAKPEQGSTVGELTPEERERLYREYMNMITSGDDNGAHDHQHNRQDGDSELTGVPYPGASF